MYDLLFFGIPGAGKGTQADLLTKAIPDTYSHLSTGDIFRSLTSKPNAIGDYVTSRMNSGKLIDDQVTIALFNAYFYAVIDENKYMLLDGYPRTPVQLDEFLDLAKRRGRKVLGVYYTLSDEEALNRLISRGREGETPEILQVRLGEYYKKTQPIIDMFADQAPLLKIDANRTVEEIHADTLQQIQSFGS